LAEDRPVDDVSEDEGTAAASTEAGPAGGLEPSHESDAALAYHQRARLAEDRLAEVLAAYRSLKKETESFRDRTARNMERKFQQRHARLLLKFIDILDNLDRALEAAQSSWAGQPLLEGMILVRTQLLQTLKAEGLERIPVLGMAFDPHVSEAVGTQPVSEPEQENLVVAELMRGYRLHGKIARASRVVIGAYRPGLEAQPTDVPVEEAATIGAAGSEASAIGTIEDAPEASGPEAEDPGIPVEEPAAVSPAETGVVLELVSEVGDGFSEDHPEPMEVAVADLAELVESPAPPPSESAAPPEEEPSLEEIIRRAEAQEALFPQAFGHGDDKDE
jgi:molecular chaperone GrpE